MPALTMCSIAQVLSCCSLHRHSPSLSRTAIHTLSNVDCPHRSIHIEQIDVQVLMFVVAVVLSQIADNSISRRMSLDGSVRAGGICRSDRALPRCSHMNTSVVRGFDRWSLRTTPKRNNPVDRLVSIIARWSYPLLSPVRRHSSRNHWIHRLEIRSTRRSTDRPTDACRRDCRE